VRVAKAKKGNGRAGRRSRRGSTFILVLAILSILILIAASLSYTARLEELSARNFADGIQARMAAVTGVGWFFSVVDGRTTGALPLGTAPLAVRLPARGTGRIPADRAPDVRKIRLPRDVSPPPPATSSPATLGPIEAGRVSLPVGFVRMGHASVVATPLVQMRIEDESAKININALGSWGELRRWGASALRGGVAVAGAESTSASLAGAQAEPVGLAQALYAVLSSPEVNYPGASPQMAFQLARAILRYRYGPDGQPGVAGVDDDGDASGGGKRSARAGGRSVGRAPFAAARNIPIFGPARREAALLPAVGSIADDGLDNDFDGEVDEPGEGVDEPDEFVADPRLPPYGDDRPFRQVEDLMYVEGMTPELFQALRPYVTVFSVSERRVGPERGAPVQMDINAATPEQIYNRLRSAFPDVPAQTVAQFVADAVDWRDSDSVPTLVYLEGQADPILGLEVTPYITEVWPDSVTDEQDGDDGQFVEIYNPYDKPISVDGWSLRVRGGGRVALRGTIVPGGFLIVTDDYNEELDPTPEDDFPNYGSFYDIFGLVPNHRNHLMVEVPTFDLPNNGGVVELCDPSGDLVDYFRYGGGAVGGVRRSYQRYDPRVRVSVVARCTPYDLGAKSPEGTYAAGKLIPASTIRNAPFRSALDLFAVKTTVFEPREKGKAVALGGPVIGSGRRDLLDERLADLFTVWADGRARSKTPEARVRESPALSDRLVGVSPAEAPSSVSECGRININTAPLPVLRALPGLAPSQIEHLVERRRSVVATDAAGEPLAYRSWSDLLADDSFWSGAPQAERIERVSRWIGVVTFASRSYRITSENLPAPPSGPRLASRATVEAVVSTDGKRNRVVVWRFLR